MPGLQLLYSVVYQNFKEPLKAVFLFFSIFYVFYYNTPWYYVFDEEVLSFFFLNFLKLVFFGGYLYYYDAVTSYYDFSVTLAAYYCLKTA